MDDCFSSRTHLGHKASPVGGAQNGAAEVANMRDGDRIQPLVANGAEEAFIPIEKTQNLKTPSGGSGDDTMKDGIEPGAIATARQHTDPFTLHERILGRAVGLRRYRRSRVSIFYSLFSLVG